MLSQQALSTLVTIEEEQEFELAPLDILTLYEARDAQKYQLWRTKFTISEEL